MGLADDSPLSIGMLDDKDDQCEGCEMSCKTRLIMGAACAALGIVMTVIGYLMLLQKDLGAFAALYTLGILGAVASSFFIAGPKKHIDRLKDCPAHLISAGVLIGAMVMVFISIFAIKGRGGTVLAIVFLIVQIVALVFFYITLNKVTWAIVKGCLGKVFPCGD